MEENKLRWPVLFLRIDNCTNCMRNAIEIFDYFNYPQRYKEIANAFQEGRPIPELNVREIYTMRCRGCGKEYAIKWEHGIPKPILNPDNRPIIFFMDKFFNMK